MMENSAAIAQTPEDAKNGSEIMLPGNDETK